MADNKQLTDAVTDALVGKAVDASIERDVAVDAAIRASGREAIAREDAREQHVEALSAQAEAAQMNTLRRLANDRADSEARGGNLARFAFYILTSIILVALVVVIVWLSTQ